MRRSVPLLLFVLGCGSGDSAQDAAAIDGFVGDGSTATRQDVAFNSDVALTGYLTTSPNAPSGSPGIVLIHQFLENDEQWGNWPEALAESGYRVLAFNLRGHGDSDPYDGNLTGLLSDVDAAPADLQAALSFLRTDGQANPDRIAIVGTSIGANLTVAAALRDEATTYVSLSCRKSAAETFAGGAPSDLRSVFYLASDGDSGGVQAADAQVLYDDTGSPRRIEVFAGSSAHGITLLNDHEGVRSQIEDWLAETL